jgi:hypothetical protein
LISLTCAGIKPRIPALTPLLSLMRRKGAETRKACEETTLVRPVMLADIDPSKLWR